MSSIKPLVINDKVEQIKVKTPANKSNAGLLTGVAVGAYAANSWRYNQKTIDKAVDQLIKLNMPQKAIEDFKQSALLRKKYSIPFMLISAGASIGCGALVDNIRNKNAIKTAEILKYNDNLKDAMTMDDNLQITDDEIPYHKSSVGSKLGAKMGALCGMAHSLMTFAVTKNQSTPMKIGAFIFSTLGMALGGWGIGALADKFANKGSEDFAKKYAEENSQKQIFA